MKVFFSLLFTLSLFFSPSFCYRVALENDSQPNILPENFYQVGKPDSEKVISLYIGLKPSNKEQLTKILHETSNPSSPTYGKWWAKKEVDNFISPTFETQQNILFWLVEENIITKNEKKMFENGGDIGEKLRKKTILFWELRCGVGVAERLLGVSFFSFRDGEKGGKPIIRTTQKYTVPHEVAPFLTIIGNIYRFPSNLAIQTAHSKAKTQNAPDIDPQSLIERYNVTVPPHNPNNLQAVASFLNQYFSDYDTKDFGKKFFNGADCQINKTIGDNYQNRPQVEASLDTQYIQFGNCSITTWDYYTSGETDLGNEPFLKWLLEVDSECSESFCPYVYSISYGDYENTVTDAYAAVADLEFQILSLTGRTFLAASGDVGVGCESMGYGNNYYNCSYFNSIFIATSPHVIACGATTKNSNKGESAFRISGGGFSDKFSRPSYQGDAVDSYFNQGKGIPSTSFFNKHGRGFPDVGVVGQDYLVYIGGDLETISGTSASTPAMAAMISMINSERLSAGLPTMGLANPFLYSAYATNKKSFVDVNTGDYQLSGCCNVGFVPVDGWEPYCGLGAPDYGVLADMALSPSFIPAFKQ